MSTVRLSGGRSTWAEFVGSRSGWIGTWQDLDGLHHCVLPGQAPAAHLLHAWAPDGRTAARLRLDGERLAVAEVSLDPAGDRSVDAHGYAPRGDDTVITWCGEAEQEPVTGALVLDDPVAPLTFAVPAALVNLWR